METNVRKMLTIMLHFYNESVFYARESCRFCVSCFYFFKDGRFITEIAIWARHIREPTGGGEKPGAETAGLSQAAEFI